RASCVDGRAGLRCTGSTANAELLSAWRRITFLGHSPSRGAGSTRPAWNLLSDKSARPGPGRDS
ncbi:MAG: hypothetical protein II770_02565, partial [Bacteroidales bacterium]|nr:hypothetical protein [Bacteroidales bacterium]